MYQMGKVSALGRDRSHGGLVEAEEVRVDEKIDGSQISFGMTGDYRVWVRSRSRELNLAEPDKMFVPGVAAILRASKEWGLVPGWTYVGEYLSKPKHNVLAYERVPRNHVVLFDVVSEGGVVFDHATVVDEAARLDFEAVQTKHMLGSEALRVVLAKPVYETSQLGGIAEGCVIKTGDLAETRIIAKVVAEQFKEIKGDRPARVGNDKQDIAVSMANKYCPPARYHKAVQKLKEAGEYTGQMRDIPKLLKLVREDIETECGEEIKETLYEAFRKDILRSSLQPVAAWYEQYLRNDNAYWTARREEEVCTCGAKFDVGRYCTCGAEPNTGVEL